MKNLKFPWGEEAFQFLLFVEEMLHAFTYKAEKPEGKLKKKKDDFRKIVNYSFVCDF